ncbi:type II toxin-antitoxin system Phd/YefM family antitoxin [Planobispora takensis]|uniref:Antitoxin n=1 Tax=Planobispora takensis TaxID=1367882 RepID=A0A8J3SY39_9ACTN|nr:type II toxin-antitoxin system Phd/YefM family antitoxin [Planobispora takensis]GII00435.1 hypothetical protein Pta02_24430 [Planobispora takensis]
MTAKKRRIGRADMQIYKMRDLNQRTAEVIQEINDSGKPAVITRHGRFVALITPLMGKGLEGELVARLLEEHGALLGERDRAGTEPQGWSSAEVAKRLGLDLP